MPLWMATVGVERDRHCPYSQAKSRLGFNFLNQVQRGGGAGNRGAGETTAAVPALRQRRPQDRGMPHPGADT